MNRRKGSNNSRRIDTDYDRKVIRVEKQLFDPRSDNPIHFNKKQDSKEESPRLDSPSKRPPASNKRLWAPENGQRMSPTIQKEKPNPNPLIKKPIIEVAKVKPLVEQDLQKEAQRKKLKNLVISLRQIEAKLENISSSSRLLPCFSEEKEEGIQDRRDFNKKKEIVQDVLIEQDILNADKIWKEKIQLHLALGEKYLEVLRCDLEYAEKKGLESLCWKRAVYSLVDQFRRALKKSADMLDQKNITQPVEESPNKLASILFDDSDDFDESVTEVPVIHEGGGMTFVKVQKKKEDVKEVDPKLQIRHTQMILSNFLHYLDMADDFYLKLTLFLKDVNDESDEDIENCLIQWRRVQRYKWYSCIQLRGDIARYRWVYTPEETNSMSYSDTDWSKPVAAWTKQEAFEEAWKRYFLGIWFMPAKGNLYFNLSLLLQQQPPYNTQGHEFHKLYFSTRSLMVRRNGFLNARESMLALFETNRRWIHKYVDEPVKSKDISKRKSKFMTPKSILRENKDATIPALFVRLHGLLFTKIGLDEFAKIKRMFFDLVFETRAPELEEYRFDGLRKAQEAKAVHDTKQLSHTHFFWMEVIVLCLSSLYTYDFANSKLSKLISLNSKRLFYQDTNDKEQFKLLSDDISDNILFSYEIDLICQIAVELFQRYLDTNIPQPIVPHIPKLPHVVLSFKENKEFLFGHSDNSVTVKPENSTDSTAWLIYIEIMLHWMVLNGICIRNKEQDSLWEMIIGDIGYDLIAYQKTKYMMESQQNSKISPAFWSLLLKFLNKLLSELTEEDKYDMINKHLLEDEEEQEEVQHDISPLEYTFAKNILNILSQEPDLPEENHLRGLGWVDDIHGRFLKLNPKLKKGHKSTLKYDMVTCRKMKILEYGFTLVKHLDDILYYDPVEEIFTLSKSVEDRAIKLAKEKENQAASNDDDRYKDLYDDENENIVMQSIEEMEDDVLLSSETDFDEQNEGDDIMTQLKKRREQLQSIVASAEAEERYGYKRLPGRIKEREARLNYLRERIIPGKTVLVLDTNCFIGHIDYVKKLFQIQKWSIIVPLVVVTELDGLRTNAQKLGFVAQEGIRLLETTLANKPKQSTSLRIQTSHNNFMNDISIRSEQFVFGESDKNLDDLILSSCLWWISQQQTNDIDHVPVCLVTGDRNLSVKARARDVEVVPVSAIIRLTPK